MRLSIHIILFFSFLFLSNMLISQDSLNTIVAKNGDGIFSVLRESGIHPIKYYEEFLNLNEGNIRNGSELIVGKAYNLPNPPDSFKNMGVKIAVNTLKEQPIFDSELGKMKLKDSTLKNAVYYLVYSKGLEDLESTDRSSSFTIGLAKGLLIRGARVYILESEINRDLLHENGNSENFGKSELGEYTSVINKKYLKHNGSYQRLLVMRDKNANKNDFVISVHHYDESKEGKRLAGALQDIFRKNAIKKTLGKDGISAFKDSFSIYLAKNLLPSVTTIDLDKNTEAAKKGIHIKSEKLLLTEMITDGILEDYSKLSFED